MTEHSPQSPPKWLAWMPAAALVVTLIGAMLTGGGYISTQTEQGRRIDALERREADTRERLIRLEARSDASSHSRARDDR